MKRIGIIDIGSNSVRLVLVEIKENNSFRIINELKETVRLGEGVDKNSKLKADRIEKAIKTLKLFKNMCDSVKVDEIIAVATAAVRKAKNSRPFLYLVKKETGIDITILSGRKEAFFAYWGVINSLDVNDCLIMDIGGGSAELVLVKDRKLLQSTSIPYGSINLSQMFNLSNNVNEEQIKSLEKFLIKTFEEIPWLKEVKNIPLIGVGGTIRNIGKIVEKHSNYPLNILHNFEMNKEDVFYVYDIVKNKKLSQRKKIKGLSKDRADVFVGACGAIVTLIEYCKIQKVIISGSGIREGLLYNYLLNTINPVSDVLDFSIENIINRYDLNLEHANHVYKLTKSLYKQILDDTNLNLNIEKLIKVAALLHDSGINIRFYNHNEHSFYMILNSGIKGLSHKELLMSSFIAASHRNKKFKINWTKYKSILNKEDIKIIKKLGLLLRIAESLDICMNSIVKDVKCDINEKDVEIKIISDSSCELEINHALSSKKHFKEVFNKNLLVF